VVFNFDVRAIWRPQDIINGTQKTAIILQPLTHCNSLNLSDFRRHIVFGILRVKTKKTKAMEYSFIFSNPQVALKTVPWHI